MPTEDPFARRVIREYLDDWAMELDDAHPRCATCSWWQPVKGDPSAHRRAMHQGDLYAASRHFFPTDMRRVPLEEVAYFFVDPGGGQLLKWFDGLVTAERWHVIDLASSIQWWRALKGADGAAIQEVAGVAESLMS